MTRHASGTETQSPHATNDRLDLTDLDGRLVQSWASHTLETMTSEECEFGVRNGMLSTYVDFVQSPDFPTRFAEAAAERGAVLLIALEPWDWDAPINAQPEFAPRVIAAGEHDEHLTEWFSTAQEHADDTQVVVRFAPEMNDTARPWSTGIGTIGYDEATPEEYVEMWRHVAAIRDRVAPDVLLMWNPLNYGAGEYPFEDYYPGDDTVDVLALDGFNWGNVISGGPGWQDSTAVFGFDDPEEGPVPRLKRLAGDKPWGIAEAASAPDDPNDFLSGGLFHDSYGSWVFEWPENPPYEAVTADWITQEGWTDMMFRRAYDSGAGFVSLFHTDKETDWRLTDTEAGRQVLSDLQAWNDRIVGAPR